ncbi:MAG: hypothetical protein O4861_24825 [Trichodesmium sp. St16_bin4-tuft]|nr:hypothetical protein [Trichodesmium sp. MAG_R01]MDE5069066.1 hypothetical protein [Trichodesmium sp. St4_bin8_1]MDE5071732.1 hypothetical protein [Trichodesmium sp. St5_bin8]MDE5077625.1 hypothetical protein [Trichodesmium sp. St2_bin6]MDE5090287.1 hypothetical protein [Trichodesmium sp. St18_bin3_1_1]MDE5101375.1 hypothetical protein [Trichodesmium sp. St16_bin4-tuft]MDE5102150.1 hypothetical protein [Trichodesmium sp. St19_bin2]
MKTYNGGRPRKEFPVIGTDKGYDGQRQKQARYLRGIRLQLPKRLGKGKKKPGNAIKISVPRFQQEGCFAWYQGKYCRLSLRMGVYFCLS